MWKYPRPLSAPPPEEEARPVPRSAPPRRDDRELKKFGGNRAEVADAGGGREALALASVAYSPSEDSGMSTSLGLGLELEFRVPRAIDEDV